MALIMNYPSIAIIGTAGRKDDKARLTHRHYDRMFKALTKLIGLLEIDTKTVKVYSGGAAWADHLAVTLALLGGCDPKNLTLFLPTAIDQRVGFIGRTAAEEKTAGICNFYHKSFKDVSGHDGINQIISVGEMGAVLDSGDGNFFSRNKSVAKALGNKGLLIAFTFGSPESDQRDWNGKLYKPNVLPEEAGVKDGGSAHTWKSAKCNKIHIRIGNTVEDDL